jgi:hypothetical protein
VLAEALGLAPLLLLLLHAVTAMTAPTANIGKTLVGGNRNRMGALLWLKRRTEGPQRGHGGGYGQLRPLGLILRSGSRVRRSVRRSADMSVSKGSAGGQPG